MASSNHMTVLPGITGRRGAQLATLVVFVWFLDFSIGWPLVSTYARELGATEALAGVIVAAYSITNLPGNVAAGYFLDRFGRRIPITTGLVVTALALAAYAFAANWEMLLVARGLHGLGAAVLTPGAFAMLGDASRQNSRVRTMGRGASAIAFAAVLGPMLAGILQERFDYEWVFFIAASFTIVSAIAYFIGSQGMDSSPHEAVQLEGETTQPDQDMSGKAFNKPGLVVACLVVLAYTFGVGTLTTYLPLHVEDLGETVRMSGYAFTGFAVAALIVMLGVTATVGDRYGRLLVVSVGLIPFAIGLLLMAATQNLWAVFAGMAVIGVGFGLLFPAVVALAADSSNAARRGLAFGIFYAAYSLGVSAGETTSGFIADTASAAPTGAPYLGAGILAIGCIAFALAAMSRGIGAVRREGAVV